MALVETRQFVCLLAETLPELPFCKNAHCCAVRAVEASVSAVEHGRSGWRRHFLRYTWTKRHFQTRLCSVTTVYHSALCFSTDPEDVRHLRDSVVTQLCPDHGMIDDAIYFTSGEVLGGVSLKKGDLVNCIAVRHGAQRGWKALRVGNLICCIVNLQTSYNWIYVESVRCTTA